MTLGGLSELAERQLEMAALSGEVQDVMTAIVETALEAVAGDGAALAVPRDGGLHFRVAVGGSLPLVGTTAPVDADYLVCRAFRERRTFVAGDIAAKAPPGSLERAGVSPGSAVLAPVVHGDRTLGVLCVTRTEATTFGEEAAHAVSALARSAAIAIRNAEIVERLTSAERASRALVEQSADATLVTDSELRIVAANGAAAALLWYTPDELVHLLFDDLMPADDPGARPVAREELMRRRELREERPLLRKDGTTVLVETAMRMLDDGRVHTALRDVTQRRRNDLRLRESLGRLRAIVDLQREISALELDPERVLAVILERTQQLTGADGATIVWLDGDTLVCRHGSGSFASRLGLEIDARHSLAALVTATGKTHYAPDAANDPRLDTAAVQKAGFRSLVCAPLARGGERVGAFSVASAQPHAFDELAVETTRLMAEFVGTSLRNVEELEARRRLAEQLRTQGEVLEHMQIGLYVWELGDDDRFRLVQMNAAADGTSGRTRDEMVGLTFDEVTPALPDAFLRDRLVTGEMADVGEHAFPDKSIEKVQSFKAFPLDARKVAVTAEDVTKRVRASEALAESEKRFRGAFDGAGIGMSLTTLDGKFLRVNDAFARMLGYTRDELLALDVERVTHPDDFPTLRPMTAEIVSGGRDDASFEKRYVRKDGSIVHARLAITVVRDHDGRPLHRVAQVVDVTELKQAESLRVSLFERSNVPMAILDDDRRFADANDAAGALLGGDRSALLGLRLDDVVSDPAVDRSWRVFLERGVAEGETTVERIDGERRLIEFSATAHAQPGRHVVVLRDLTQQKDLELQLRQAQKMEAVGRLAGGIAHDFNNLLTAISGYSEFLTARIEEPRLRRHAEEIRKAAARAAALTGQLLAFSRRQVLQPRTLDLNEVVLDMEMMLRRLIGEDVELVTTLDPELHAVRADPTQIEQVIVNLAVNARDAMATGGSAILRTRNVHEGVELSLTDTGVGMTPQERQHLFDPFFTTKDGGTGLGLATVYGIVEQSGGTIEVDSEPGLGSCFRIVLPRVEDAAERGASPRPEAAPESGSETILLVEDESVVRQLVAEILETSGYTVLQATDGPSALELLRRHSGPVDLLVTDVVMPGMSGPDVAKAVTSMRPGTQVLFTSGYTDSAIDHHGVLRPGIAFLQKPFSADDLTRKVRSLVEETAV